MRGHTPFTTATLGLLSAGLLTACTGVSGEGPDTDTAADTDSTIEDTDTDTDTEDTDAGPREFVYEAGDCDVDVGGLATADLRTIGENSGVLFPGASLEGRGHVVLDDATALEAYAAAWEMELDGSVDFETERAIGVHVYSAGSCGYGVERQRVFDADGTLHIDYQAADYVWDCEYGCDAPSGVVWILAVPRSSAVTTCVRQIHRCG